MKKYPMNGPSLEIQRLMQSPRANRERLEQYFRSKPEMREETKAIVKLR